MERSTNALAELAERLTPKEVLNIEGMAVAREIDFDALVKAQRIIEKLAKVENKPRSDEPWLGDAVGAIKKCRAIAEEGDGYGK